MAHVTPTYGLDIFVPSPWNLDTKTLNSKKKSTWTLETCIMHLWTGSDNTRGPPCVRQLMDWDDSAINRATKIFLKEYNAIKHEILNARGKQWNSIPGWHTTAGKRFHARMERILRDKHKPLLLLPHE